MSERYWVNGVQLGRLLAVPDEKTRKDLVQYIIDKQFIGKCKTEKDKKQFEKIIKAILNGK